MTAHEGASCSHPRCPPVYINPDGTAATARACFAILRAIHRPPAVEDDISRAHSSDGGCTPRMSLAMHTHSFDMLFDCLDEFYSIAQQQFMWQG